MNQTSRANEAVAVRLEGGIGDHVLGLRLLPFVRAAHPRSTITLYSDAAGGAAQREVAGLSPFADRVRSLRRKPGSVSREQMGQLETLQEEDQRALREAAYFYDAWGGTYFLDAARALDVPVFEILATRPEIRIPDAVLLWAGEELARHGDCRFIAMNLSKYGPEFLHLAIDSVREILGEIGARTDVRILNLYSRRFGFEHWPDDVLRMRVEIQRQEAEILDQVSNSDDRIVPLIDLNIVQLAAMLRRCCYFIGVDNGIRHLAWALGLRSTVLMPDLPDPHFALRWIHDYHRVITPSDSAASLGRHAASLGELLDSPKTQ